MFKIGRGMSRNVQTKFVDAKKEIFSRNNFSPLKAFKEFLECILSQTTPLQIYSDPFLNSLEQLTFQAKSYINYTSKSLVEIDTI